MIEHIEIEGFKSLEKVSLDLGALNIFVGTNASGKTNFLEALRVLQGIGYGYTIDEIFNGKPKGANSEAWEGVRGGSAFAEFRCSNSHPAKAHAKPMKFVVTLSDPVLEQPLCYAISISAQRQEVEWEKLSQGEAVIYETDLAESTFPVRHARVVRNYPSKGTNVYFHISRPVLRQLEEDPNCSAEHRSILSTCRVLLSDIQFLSPAPVRLREYSKVSSAGRIGDNGENFAALVKSILGRSEAGAYKSWLKHLTPAELDDVVILTGAVHDYLFALRRNGTDYPAPVLSDGTLRFAAIAAGFFQPDPPRALVLEEIEDGLHPTRLRLLMELLKSQAGTGISQVMATSHSPLAIAWLDEDDYRTVFLCSKDDENGASSITPFSSIPRLIELARTQSVADLFAEGWLESAI